jgi:Raf kinase inhibitor-like YbhB/YbcL family protein
MQLRASRFDHGADIPPYFTCDGGDLSPALTWTAAPAGTRSLALIVEDPDAPAHTWIHWVLYDIPPGERGLPEGVGHTAKLSAGTRQGTNDFGNTGYGGPCPPPGAPHRYFFRIYALDSSVALDAGATAADLRRAMRGHVVAEAELMGRYGRKR